MVDNESLILSERGSPYETYSEVEGDWGRSGHLRSGKWLVCDYWLQFILNIIGQEKLIQDNYVMLEALVIVLIHLEINNHVQFYLRKQYWMKTKENGWDRKLRGSKDENAIVK